MGTQGTGPRRKCGSHHLGLQLAAEPEKTREWGFVRSVLFVYPKAISAGSTVDAGNVEAYSPGRSRAPGWPRFPHSGVFSCSKSSIFHSPAPQFLMEED